MHGNTITMSHTVRYTCDWLWHYNLEVIVHPSYSHSLMPSDFHLFGLLKKHLAGKQFATYACMKQTLHCWLHTLDTDFYYTNIKSRGSMLRHLLKCQWRLHRGGESDENLLQSMCHACVRSQNKVLVLRVFVALHFVNSL